jgi:large subunit ribosomal protein L1
MTGKRLKEIYKNIDLEKVYTAEEAINIIKSNSKAKFDEAVDICFKLNIDPKYQDQALRELVQLPEGLGKQVRVAVIATSDKHEEANKAGADLVGAEDIIDQIKSGKIDFDFCIATPDMMPKIGAVAKILGPKGLMPNPKLGSVTKDVKGAVENAKKGQVEVKADKFGNVHAAIAKVSFTVEKIKNNFDALLGIIKTSKPSGVKGAYIKDVFIGSTMGPSFKITIS